MKTLIVYGTRCGTTLEEICRGWLRILHYHRGPSDLQKAKVAGVDL